MARAASPYYLRPVPTRPICRLPTAIVSQFPSVDSSGFRILNMFNTASRPTITEFVVEMANSARESADSMANFTADPPACVYEPSVWLLRL